MPTFRPDLKTYRCVICGTPTAQRHHITYDRDVDSVWSHDLFALCDFHHVHLHELHDGLGRRVPLAVFSANYIVNPHGTAARAIGQLNFGEQLGHQGEAWRAWEASCLSLLREHDEGRKAA